MNSQADVMPAKRYASIDGVRQTRPGTVGIVTRPVHPQKRRIYSPPRPEPNQRSRWQTFQLPLLLVAGSFAGFFADTLAIGLSMLVVYAVVAFVTRIPSRVTFTLALLLLAAISVMLLLKPSAILIGNFSTYAFVLLLIGVITLGKESRLPKRTRRKYRR